MDEEVMDYVEDIGVIPDTNVAGLFIRDFIILNGPSSAWRLYKAWKLARRRQGKRGPTYQSFWRNYIWPLKKLGLLMSTYEEEGLYEGTRPPKPLAISGDPNHPAWWDPMGYLYEGRTAGRTPETPREKRTKSLLEEFMEAIERGRREYEKKKKTKKRSTRKKSSRKSSRKKR